MTSNLCIGFTFAKKKKKCSYQLSHTFYLTLFFYMLTFEFQVCKGKLEENRRGHREHSWSRYRWRRGAHVLFCTLIPSLTSSKWHIAQGINCETTITYWKTLIPQLIFSFKSIKGNSSTAMKIQTRREIQESKIWSVEILVTGWYYTELH